MSTIRKRTRLFIARRFQIRYISLILVFMFSTAIVTGYMVYVTTWVMFGEKLAAVYPQGLLLDIVKKVNMVLLLRLLLLTPLVILIGLILSNRIAGPIYRIKRFLRHIAAGNYGESLKLREKDELQDVADSINHLVSRLSSEQKRRRERVNKLKSRTGELKNLLVSGECDKERILAQLDQISEELDRFQ
ncbi:MAG: HAMP domain-containing protein [Candidatus Omnitrophica bacterium]|nr:HAMP domain-containing protein [Candidatus Omnitrophota bacterium]